MMFAPNGLQLALITAGILGFRHGFDYDHIAAISDIASVETSPRSTMKLGLLYAIGHAATLAVLGSAVVLFQVSLPKGIDRIAERLVGLTLLLLGIYVLGSLLRGGQERLPRSRAVLLARLFHWTAAKLHLRHSHSLPQNWTYSPKSVIAIGVVHGLGAETPSQLLLFLLAANLGGVAKGFLGLAMFVVGLLAMNTLMTASAAGLFGFSAKAPGFQTAVTALTAVYSLIVGTMFLTGWSSSLPPLGG